MPGQKKEVNAPGKFHPRRQGRSEILTNNATRPDLLGQTLSKEFDKDFHAWQPRSEISTNSATWARLVGKTCGFKYVMT